MGKENSQVLTVCAVMCQHVNESMLAYMYVHALYPGSLVVGGKKRLVSTVCGCCVKPAVHMAAVHMAAALAGCRKPFVGTDLAISFPFDTNGCR